MNQARIIRFVAKPAVFVASLVPLALLVSDAVGGRLGAEPIREIQLRTGWWSLTFLLITLAVTPVRQLTRWNGAVKLRRMLGLFAFFYAILHLSNYVGVDQYFDWSAIGEDIAKRPWITIGLTALLLLVPLAATSTQGMIRRLGKRWGALHRLVYVAAACGVLHFLWLVKQDTSEPATFGVVLVALLAFRLRSQRKAAKPRPFPRPAAPERVPVGTFESSS